MESPLDKQMAAIKDKADLITWCSNLPDNVEGCILVTNPDTGRVTVRHLGDITLPRALWNAELYKKWIISQ